MKAWINNGTEEPKPADVRGGHLSPEAQWVYVVLDLRRHNQDPTSTALLKVRMDRIFLDADCKQPLRSRQS